MFNEHEYEYEHEKVFYQCQSDLWHFEMLFSFDLSFNYFVFESCALLNFKRVVLILGWSYFLPIIDCVRLLFKRRIVCFNMFSKFQRKIFEIVCSKLIFSKLNWKFEISSKTNWTRLAKPAPKRHKSQADKWPSLQDLRFFFYSKHFHKR